ncbi:molecular chaperone [Aeromonas salmonicida]|uniref:fimbrial biogenesis chaperone n=1 Tax=Aeromonas salmonicida TaxID=645 RepID=UPI00259E8629|nr:molecular chaperone [Aeromonas salmonicida]MDM5065434.1 molecular chaperone [Aeromonas salmonicida]
MRISNFLAAALILLISDYSYAAISLSSTRIIYNASQKEASINVTNGSVRETVIQTWLDMDGNNNQAPPFAVTPPLAKIKGNQRQLLRVLYQGVGLPEDRESVFWLSVQEIPQLVEGENVLQLALMQRIKLFYRPNGLSGEQHLAPEKLKIKVTNNQLEINNPTPYYINMVSLEKDSIVIDGEMIAPMSRIYIPVRSFTANGAFSFGIVNDFGAVVNYIGEFDQGVASVLSLHNEK